MAFTPELLVAIFVEMADLLNGTPAEDGVVTDEGSGIAVGHTEANGDIDEVGEESDAVFEIGMSYLHDTGCELEDGDLRVVLELGDGVEETVNRNFGVGVN